MASSVKEQQQLGAAAEAIASVVAFDSADAEASDLSRLLDDSSQPHRYYYGAGADVELGASTAWKVGRRIAVRTAGSSSAPAICVHSGSARQNTSRRTLTGVCGASASVYVVCMCALGSIVHA